MNDITQRNSAVLEVSDYNIDRLLDEVATFSAIGKVELKLLQTQNTSEYYEFISNPSN